MLNMTSGVEKGKMYYFVEYANGVKTENGWKYGVTYAICDTHQKANGIVRKDTNANMWSNSEWNPLTVVKGYFI